MPPLSPCKRHRRNARRATDSARVDPSESVAAGEVDVEPLFAILDDAIRRVGARRIVLDTIEVLFGAFGDDAIVRSELSRLVRFTLGAKDTP